MDKHLRDALKDLVDNIMDVLEGKDPANANANADSKKNKMLPIDRKFKIQATSLEHGHFHDENDSILFLCKDKALIHTLRFYKGSCIAFGAEDAQIKGIDLLMERVENWQRLNAFELKVADVDLPSGKSIIEPNT